MSIEREDAKISLNFTYSHEDEDRDTEIKIMVQFGQTEEFGDTISCSSDGEEWFSFPAEFFKEVSDFLVEKGVFMPTSPSLDAAERKVSIINRSTTAAITPPSIERKAAIPVPPNAITAQPVTTSPATATIMSDEDLRSIDETEPVGSLTSDPASNQTSVIVPVAVQAARPSAARPSSPIKTAHRIDPNEQQVQQNKVGIVITPETAKSMPIPNRPVKRSLPDVKEESPYRRPIPRGHSSSNEGSLLPDDFDPATDGNEGHMLPDDFDE